MELQRQAPNFDAIYQELKKPVRDKVFLDSIRSTVHEVTYVKEYKSISIHAPRRTGKTTFILKKLVEEDGIMIVANYKAKEALLNQLSKEDHFRLITSDELYQMSKETTLSIKERGVKNIFADSDGVTNSHWLAVTLVNKFGQDIEITYIGS